MFVIVVECFFLFKFVSMNFKWIIFISVHERSQNQAESVEYASNNEATSVAIIATTNVNVESSECNLCICDL